MTRFPAVEAESFFLAVFLFFRGNFGNFDGIYIHRVRVMEFRGGWGKCLIMRRFDVPSSDLVSVVPLGLKMNCFLVPVIDGGRDGIHRHDAVHEGRGNPGGIVANENIFIINGGHSYVVLEEGGVFCEGWGVFISSYIFPGLVESQAMAFDFMSWCSNTVLKLAIKTEKVSIVIMEPTRALCLKVVAQVRVGPLVI